MIRVLSVHFTWVSEICSYVHISNSREEGISLSQLLYVCMFVKLAVLFAFHGKLGGPNSMKLPKTG